MTEATETILLDPRGKDFALVRIDSNGKRSELLLSAANIMAMPKIFQETCQKILAARTTQGMEERGVSPVIMVPVVQFALNTDLHKSEIHIEMHDQFGNRTGFALPVEIARPLAERLPARLAEIEKAKPTKQ